MIIRHTGVKQPNSTIKKEYRDIHKDGKHLFDGCCVPRDPLNIPELREILQDPERIRETQATKTRLPVHVSIPNTLSAAVPPDIVLMTMDFLPGRRDIELLLWAFPQWTPLISQRYWRRHCIRDYILPEELLPVEDEIDWRWFYFTSTRCYASQMDGRIGSV